MNINEGNGMVPGVQEKKLAGAEHST